ncbi:MAG: SRPBCC family protein [Myxococcota bacterium]|jgi:hypothetical protein|nr:SRPBCC family protein [Myxococcota bacterium]
MKYTTNVEIDVPRARAVELFTNPDHYATWQESLVSLERLEGEPGQVGTRTQLQHRMGKREITMLETITETSLPDAFSATYTAKGVFNQATNRFSALDGDRTAWTMETEFRCSGMMWVLTTFAPGMFKKQTQAAMVAFKVFAEAEAAPETAPDELPSELQGADDEGTGDEVAEGASEEV